MFSKSVIIDNDVTLTKICGTLNVNIEAIERTLYVKIRNQYDDSTSSENLIISGEEGRVRDAVSVIENLIKYSSGNDQVPLQYVDYLLSILNNNDVNTSLNINENLFINFNGKQIKPKTYGQKKYIDEIAHNSIVFGIGPAGTGKTYLAVLMAVKALKKQEIKRIILTRPAVEAGERLGFLPGDLISKINPYLRPLYDALYDFLGFESTGKLIERNVIEIAPLAYMRGRTLDDSFIILDEAQNTTNEQMKMFLTRMGNGSKIVVTGDLSQTDLPRDVKSGLGTAVRLLNNIDDIFIHKFSSCDVVRHKLVQKIIDAYDKSNDNSKEKKN